MASPAQIHSEPSSALAQAVTLPVQTRQLSRERIESSAQTVIMLAIGIAAGAASFTHVHDVAAAHGQPGWLAWTDAIVLELASYEEFGSTVMTHDRRSNGPLPVGCQ